MKVLEALMVGIGVVVAAAAVSAEEPAKAACVPRAGEKLGVRFVEVCAKGFFISAAPLACAAEESESAACDPVTALEISPLEGAGKNRHVDARVTDAATAARLCETRLGGRLPTPAEREQARLGLGLVSLQVREEPGPFARLRLDELAEWVAEGDRVTRSPEVVARPRVAGEVLLGCVAEPAMPQARFVPIGEACDERPSEGGVRSPGCALGLAGGAARFELGCDPQHAVPSRSRPEHAAFRCVVPERALGRVEPAP
jgi:hypothetical protein